MEEEKVKKIKNSMYSQVNTRGYVTIVDTFMDIGILGQEQYRCILH